MTTTDTAAAKATAKALLETTLDKIKSVADAATTEDRAMADNIIARAKEGKEETIEGVLSPAVCALLFLLANGWNRVFHPEVAVEYARRMVTGVWKRNGEGISFYLTGNVAWR